MSSDVKELYTIRNYKPYDKAFILATWLKALRYGNDWFELIEAKSYYGIYKQVISVLLDRPTVSIKIACLKDDEDVILGYSVYEGQKLHFVFVKLAWRKVGIANSLIPANITTATHLTKIGRSLLKNKKWAFNPLNL